MIVHYLKARVVIFYWYNTSLIRIRMNSISIIALTCVLMSLLLVAVISAIASFFSSTVLLFELVFVRWYSICR